jgi:uncharacterized OsmC-like protein
MLTMGRMAAKRRRIELRSFSIEIDGVLDLDGLMGKDPSKRTGFEDIQIKAFIDADISDEEKMAFLEEIEKSCPAADNVMNQSKISLKLG